MNYDQQLYSKVNSPKMKPQTKPLQIKPKATKKQPNKQPLKPASPFIVQGGVVDEASLVGGVEGALVTLKVWGATSEVELTVAPEVLPVVGLERTLRTDVLVLAESAKVVMSVVKNENIWIKKNIPK